MILPFKKYLKKIVLERLQLGDPAFQQKILVDLKISHEDLFKLSADMGFVTNKTSAEDVKSLIKNLRPISPHGVPLIRLGALADGGYLVPDDLGEIEACFSPGVAGVSSFELDCAKRGMKVFMADKSVDSPTENHKLFHFLKKFVGASVDEDYTTLEKWVKDSLENSKSDLLLQMDIEGFEWETILSVSDELLNRFRIIVLECHYLEQLWNYHFFFICSRVFQKILKSHRCVHIHPNNVVSSYSREGIEIPPGLEITFYRRDRIRGFDETTLFPHPLDRDNTNNPPVVLPREWYAA
jgi:hypothetical protein